MSPHRKPITHSHARTAMVLAFALGLATGLVGCPKQALVIDTDWVKKHADENLLETLGEALEAHASGDMKTALALLDTARSRTSDPQMLAFIGLREGMAHLRIGNPSTAEATLAPVVSSGFEDLAARASVLHSLALFQLDRPGDAGDILAGLDLTTARKATDDPELQHDLLAASGDLALQRGEWQAACLRFAWATQGEGTDAGALETARELMRRLEETMAKPAVQGQAPLPSHAQLLSSVPAGGSFWALLALKASRDALLEWDLVAAENGVAQLHAEGFVSLAAPLEETIASARSELDGTDPTTIGAILPLSGKNAGIGKMMQAGIETALRILSADHDFKVVFLDTAGSADQTRQHLKVLKEEHRAIAVIGPAAGGVAKAAAAEAEALGMPLITLTLKPGVTDAGPHVFRNFSTHDVEARILAEYAVKTAGLERCAVIHPDSTYGHGMAKQFAQSIAALGGEVALTQTFAPAESNFVEIASKLAEHEDIRCIFVPATSQQLGLIAPALAYKDVWAAPPEDLGKDAPGKKGRTVLILATQVGYSPDLPAKAGKYLQGTVFSAGFYAETPDPFAQFFIQEFEREHVGRVTSYHAHAADALFIIATAVALGGVRTRAQLPAWLSDPAHCTTDTSTVASFGGFDESGEPLAPLQLFRLSGKTYEALAQ
ncbi:MAG: penicillin-binding protein activator [Deltaproteobacteria bacterium]|nr:penicillin-binding protein activator [Deltaproteobacteria bacterium]